MERTFAQCVATLARALSRPCEAAAARADGGDNGDDAALRVRPPWGWAAAELAQVLQRYPSGLTREIVETELALRWAGAASEWSAASEPARLKLVRVAAVLEAPAALAAHHVLAAQLVAVRRAPTLRNTLLFIADAPSAPEHVVPALLHSRFVPSVLNEKGLWRQGRTLRLTGTWARQQLVPPGASMQPLEGLPDPTALALLPTELLVPVLAPDEPLVQTCSPTALAAMVASAAANPPGTPVEARRALVALLRVGPVFRGRAREERLRRVVVRDAGSGVEAVLALRDALVRLTLLVRCGDCLMLERVSGTLRAAQGPRLMLELPPDACVAVLPVDGAPRAVDVESENRRDMERENRSAELLTPGQHGSLTALTGACASASAGCLFVPRPAAAANLATRDAPATIADLAPSTHGGALLLFVSAMPRVARDRKDRERQVAVLRVEDTLGAAAELACAMPTMRNALLARPGELLLVTGVARAADDAGGVRIECGLDGGDPAAQGGPSLFRLCKISGALSSALLGSQATSLAQLVRTASRHACAVVRASIVSFALPAVLTVAVHRQCERAVDDDGEAGGRHCHVCGCSVALGATKVDFSPEFRVTLCDGVAQTRVRVAPDLLQALIMCAAAVAAELTPAAFRARCASALLGRELVWCLSRANVGSDEELRAEQAVEVNAALLARQLLPDV